MQRAPARQACYRLRTLFGANGCALRSRTAMRREPSAYMSFVSSNFSMIQLFARITGRRNTSPKASEGIR